MHSPIDPQVEQATSQPEAMQAPCPAGQGAVTQKADRRRKYCSDLIMRERQHQTFSECILLERTPEGPVLSEHSPDRRLKHLIDKLEQLYEAIRSSDKSPCMKRAGRLPYIGWRGDVYRLTVLGLRTHECCVSFLELEDERDRWVQENGAELFSPRVTLMYQAMKRWAKPVGYLLDPSISIPTGSPDAEAAISLQRMVKVIRRIDRSWIFRNKLATYERKANDNFRSAADFVTGLFSTHSRILVLRIDCYLVKGAKRWAVNGESERVVRKFARALRENKIVPGYLGMICKREHGISRGMHWHWMIFLDGHKHRAAYHLTRALGEKWSELTEGQGTYFNCYVRRHEYKFNGLGLVKISDEGKLRGIRAAIDYLTKRNCVLKTNDGKQQIFRRSKPRKTARANRGAPRQASDSLALVRRMLGGGRSPHPPGFVD